MSLIEQSQRDKLRKKKITAKAHKTSRSKNKYYNQAEALIRYTIRTKPLVEWVEKELKEENVINGFVLIPPTIYSPIEAISKFRSDIASARKGDSIERENCPLVLAIGDRTVHFNQDSVNVLKIHLHYLD